MLGVFSSKQTLRFAPASTRDNDPCWIKSTAYPSRFNFSLRPDLRLVALDKALLC